MPIKFHFGKLLFYPYRSQKVSLRRVLLTRDLVPLGAFIGPSGRSAFDQGPSGGPKGPAQHGLIEIDHKHSKSKIFFDQCLFLNTNYHAYHLKQYGPLKNHLITFRTCYFHGAAIYSQYGRYRLIDCFMYLFYSQAIEAVKKSYIELVNTQISDCLNIMAQPKVPTARLLLTMFRVL